MRPFLPLACAFALALALPARAADDPFAEFRIPEHRWRTGSAGGAFSASRLDQTYDQRTSRRSLLYSALTGALRFGWDSDALQYGFAVSATGNVSDDDSHNESTGSPYRYRDDYLIHRWNEAWELDGSLRVYPWTAPVGLGSSASVWGVYSQGQGSATHGADYPDGSTRESYLTRTARAYQTGAAADLSVGLGRVRDASVVYDVHLLEERLVETGALVRALSPAARAKLAALYYVTPFFGAAHERPDRFVWREIERLLREDGALGEGGLDPYSVLRAREPVAPASRPMRQRGWFVGFVGQFSTRNNINHQTEEYGSRMYLQDSLTYDNIEYYRDGRVASSSDEFAPGAVGEGHLPVGWRWQLDATARVMCPASGVDASSRASLAWFVADRWSAFASFAYDRDYLHTRDNRNAPTNGAWVTQAGVGLAYYLEDHTSLSLAASQVQQENEQRYYGRVFSRYGLVSLGITYQFLGRLDAPGLIEPVQPIH